MSKQSAPELGAPLPALDDLTPALARAILDQYGAMSKWRDPIVRACFTAGLGVMEIHKRTGIARTTIDRILDRG